MSRRWITLWWQVEVVGGKVLQILIMVAVVALEDFVLALDYP